MSRALAAGGECDAYCTKCKRDTLHNIVAMEGSGGVPAQVVCRSCQGMHKYRVPKSAPSAKQTVAAKAASVKAAASGGGKPKAAAVKAVPAGDAAALKRWEELLARFAGGEAQRYVVTANWVPQDAIEHREFGLGFVVEEVAWNRVKVAFRDGERVLVARHGQQPPA